MCNVSGFRWHWILNQKLCVCFMGNALNLHTCTCTYFLSMYYIIGLGTLGVNLGAGEGVGGLVE